MIHDLSFKFIQLKKLLFMKSIIINLSDISERNYAGSQVFMQANLSDIESI